MFRTASVSLSRAAMPTGLIRVGTSRAASSTSGRIVRPFSSNMNTMQQNRNYSLFVNKTANTNSSAYKNLNNLIQSRSIFVIAEQTPNPESKMFYPQGCVVLGEGAKSKSFEDKFVAKDSLLAMSLFRVQGVENVMLAPKHVTVTKNSDADWKFVQSNVEMVMSQFFASNLEPIDKAKIEYINDASKQKREDSDAAAASDDFETELLQLIEERVKPFVQQDGGDVNFDRYENNIVFLKMEGACKGCPKSGITLNIQIKQLIQHYFPEVVDVQEAIDPNDEYIPRPGDKNFNKEFNG